MESMIGKFATSKAGHDKGKCYVIVGVEDEFVYLSDGRLKTMEAPKRKRKKHIQLINCTVGSEILERLAGADKVSNEEIKYEIKKYLKHE